MKAFNVSAVLFFFCPNIFDPNCFLTGIHIDEKHFLIPARVAWMIERKGTAYVYGLKRKKVYFMFLYILYFTWHTF